MGDRALSKIWILIILIVILAGGILAWQYWNKLIETGEKTKKGKLEEEVFIGPEGWQKYINEKYGYVIFYPSNWETKDLSKEPGGHFRVFAEHLTEKFIKNFAQMKNGILIHVAFSKLPLEMFMEHGSNISSLFLQTPPQKIKINGGNGLLYISSSEDGTKIRCIAVKNKDYVIMIFIGDDYEKEVYKRILANFHLVEPKGIFISEEETISTQDWKLYTDKPFGRNPFGYSVPGWSLSMKLPPNLEGSRGVFSILKKGTKEPSGIELHIGVNLLGGELREKFKTLITQYRNMAPGEAIIDINSRPVIKIDDINLGGCVGPQIFIEGIGASNIVGYQTLCSLGDEVGDTTVVFSLQTYREHAELLDKYKPLYDTILSTFRYKKF